MASGARHWMYRSVWNVARLVIRKLVRDGAVAVDPDVIEVKMFNPSSRPDEPRSNHSLAAERPLCRWHPHNVVRAELENGAHISSQLLGQPALFETSNRLKVSVVEHAPDSTLTISADN
jgi:hypothetical protein